MKHPNHIVLYTLITACCVIEFVLTASEFFLPDFPSIRKLAYHFGAFWPGLLQDWTPNYKIQPYLMFLSYGLLHGGLVHLTVNMISLWSLGRAVIAQFGTWDFVLLYVWTSLCGAAVFAALGNGVSPMVGASGALFGLMGALKASDFQNRETNADGIKDIGRFVIIFSGLNLVLWWAMSGQLAWETHLGGMLSGWIGAMFIEHKNRRLN